MKNKDPALLPTIFLVDRLSDVLCNYERQWTEECTPKEVVSSINSGLEPSSKHDVPHLGNDKSICSISGRATPANDGLVKKYHERRCSLQCKPVHCSAEKGFERRHSHPLATAEEKLPRNENESSCIDLKEHKAPPCSKDSHVYAVEGQKVNYSLHEDIKLNFSKYCNDGVRCNSWADNIHAILSDCKGRVTDFNKLKVSDGGWLLLCKPKSEGSLRAIVKANEKPITSFDINVYSVFTEPIDV